MAPIQQTVTRLRYEVAGARRLSSYLTALALTIGGLGFLLAGLSTFAGVNLLPFTDIVGNPQFNKFPQGAVLSAYGALGSLFALYYWLTIFLNVGAGYNEFDKKSGKVTIYRSGFLGKDRHVNIQYPLNMIQGIRVVLKDGLNPRRLIYLKVKGKGDIRLSGVEQPPTLTVLEEQAATMAQFLGVSIEGI
ncbi:photosystem I assembly protein Ycf4 [Candidatus Cyanaurora vandensis]|uniref:photosystem I assembly protein Ycf4 n=1 Tax=Candidatus Cyanaurora vandensis TaxID=2714958 RepID=UPI00257973C7|nr:photosystem I assembly protein Ycf4 [Candidatus Cyanaurora vandensis]